MDFNALVLEEGGGEVTSSVRSLRDEDLPDGDVTVRVEYSTLNYKDGLILEGLGGLVRKYPHVPGIDLAGVVESSTNPSWTPGDRVILTGWRVGEVHWGGYSGKARVRGEWLVAAPEGLSTRRAMAIGTAGFTAMLALMALEEHGLAPGQGDVLVTGASGGLGSVAVALLANLGYTVVASTGKADCHAYLKALGAAAIIDRAELGAPSARPLLSERWAGCVDSVGGPTLANALAATKYHRSVAACGLAATSKLETTVIPFIIRGVNLLGIDSATCPTPRRIAAWERLARDLPMDRLDAMTSSAALADLPGLAVSILKGGIRGRVLVDPNA